MGWVPVCCKMGPCMQHVTDLVRPHLDTVKTTMGMVVRKVYLTTIMIFEKIVKIVYRISWILHSIGEFLVHICLLTKFDLHIFLS